MAADKCTGAGYGGSPLHEGEDLGEGESGGGLGSAVVA